MAEGAEYEVLTSAESADLSAKVTQRMAEGWRPAGGVSLAIAPASRGVPTYTYAQAMVLPPQEPSGERQFSHGPLPW